MFKIYYVIVFSFLVIYASEGLFAQKIDESDSALIKKYWNRVNIQSLSSKNNNLYNGIDNYIQLVYPDEPSSTFQYYITTNNGNIYEYDEISYLTIPKIIGKSFVSIHVITGENDTLLIGKKQFPVLNLPFPALKIGNTIIKEQSNIDKQAFLNGDTLKVFFFRRFTRKYKLV